MEHGTTRDDALALGAGDDLKQVAVETQEVRRLKAKVAEQSCEIAKLTLLVRDAEAATLELIDQREWFGRVALLLQTQPGWWSYMPKAWCERRLRRRLALQGAFDGDAYLRRYPDVGASGMDPLLHYMMHGIVEGRER